MVGEEALIGLGGNGMFVLNGALYLAAFLLHPRIIDIAVGVHAGQRPGAFFATTMVDQPARRLTLIVSFPWR